MDRIVTIPTRFYDDHVDRDLSAGTVVKRTKTSVTVSLDEEALAELISDAEHYAGGAANGFDDPYFFGLVSSARATLRKLTI